MTGRANAIGWFDTQVSQAALSAPFTGGQGFGFLDWEDSKVFDFPESFDGLDHEEQSRLADLKKTADTQHRTTGDMWRKAVLATRRIDVEMANFAVEECLAELKNLNRVVEEKYERNQMPGLSASGKAMEKIQGAIKKLLEQKRAEEPDESDFVESVDGEVSADGSVVAGGGGGGPAGPIQSRRDALRRLAEVAEYFQRAEPHSPVSYIVQRAVKWGNMPLESWLQDVIKDESVLYNLRQTLGMDVGGEGYNSGSTE
jgi:type VI secretion system protein ImpA